MAGPHRGRRARCARHRRRYGRAHERPAAADRQGRRLGAFLRDVGAVAADLGGSGFPQDYPIEQYIRDAKIDSLYEGTTAIQGLDFFFRKMVRDQFKAVFHLAGQITETVKGGADGDQLSAERELLGTALEDVQETIGKLGEWAMASQTDVQQIYRVGLNTTRLLMMVGDLVIGWLLLHAGRGRASRPTPARRREGQGLLHRQGRGRQVVRPQPAAALTSEKVAAMGTELDLMELPEAPLIHRGRGDPDRDKASPCSPPPEQGASSWSGQPIRSSRSGPRPGRR